MAPPERFELPTPSSEAKCSESAELWGLNILNYSEKSLVTELQFSINTAKIKLLIITI